MLELVGNDVENSKMMHDLGVSTKLATQLEQYVADPLKAMLDSYGNLYKNVRSMMQDLLIRYFNKNKLVILKAFDVSLNNELVYFIVLKEDTFENRDLFFDFLSEYDTLGFQSKVPLTIKFLPQRVMDKANLQNEIVLS